MLTAGVDMGEAFVGTEKSDIYYSLDALIPSTLAQKETWTTGDTLDGKEGNDILNIQTGIAMGSPVLNLTSIETVNVNSTNTVALNGSAWDGTNTLNVTKATAATLTAAATTDVNVSGVTTGAVAVDGGKNVNVTVAATGTNTTIGAATGAAGTVTVTDAAQNGAIKVDGGTDVTITASGNNGAGETIQVGKDATPILPTGVVTVTSTGSYTDGGNTTMGAIAIDGGSTVTVTQSAGITDAQKTAALTDGSNSKVIQGAITIKGDGNTTTVNVKQDATVAAGNATVAVAGSTQTQTVTFNALAAGNTVTVNGLTFTAAKDLTAAEVAAAFANLAASDTQSNTGITTNGSYTGTNSATFTTGAVVGNTVVYSEVTNGTNAGVLVPSTAKAGGVTTPIAPTAVITTTSAGTTPGVDGKIGVDAAIVTVTDDAVVATADKIKTVTIDGYATTSSVISDALTDLTLKNGDEDAVFTVTNAVASSSLTLNVDNITTTGTAEIDLDGSAGKITTLTINATGSDSEFILTGTGIKDLTINATADLDISGSATTAYATTALKTVDVNGAGSVNLGDLTNSALNTFDASGNTGGVTAEINTLTASVGTITEYVFSAGNDVVTLAETTVNTKVTLGAGDDIVTLASGTTALAAVIDGGTGSDTLAMVVADANTVTSAGTSDFENKISGFEKLSLTATAANAAVDLSLFDDINYVISAGTAAFTLALSNMANNGTLELTGATNAAGDITVTMKDASGTADTFNIVTKVDNADITFAGDVVVAGVETININAIDLSPVNTTTGVATIEEASLIVTANLAKTVNVTGSSDVDLTLTGSTLVTLIDATNLTGALTATTAISTSAATIKGGSGADDLTATTTNDKLYGNAGADTLIVNNGANLVQLYGGADKDIYKIGLATNSNGYATINGTKAELSGDVIQFINSTVNTNTTIAGISSLAKIDNLGSTAVFQDYVNEAAKGTTADHKVAWFQLDGNTYVVQNNSTLDSFANGVDAVVKITGLVDLTFNAANVLEIA